MAEEAPEEALAEVKEVHEEVEVASEDGGAKPEDESSKPETESAKLEGEAVEAQNEVVKEGEEEPASREERPSEIEGEFGEEIEEEVYMEPREISAEEHEENIVAMGDVLHTILDLAAEGKLPAKKEKEEFEMRRKTVSTEDLLAEPHMEEIEEIIIEDEYVTPEGSEEEKVGEEEEVESASVQEAWIKRQQLLEEFDTVHDEAQRLRIMNMLLHSRVLRAMHRRPKQTKGSSVSAYGASTRTLPAVEETQTMAESLEKELLEAGEVRRQLDAELHRGTFEEELRERLSTARRIVTEKCEQLQQLQEKAMSKLRAQPVRRQEAERMLKRVWPQLLRVRKERLLHTRAQHDLESARQQVAELEVFGPQRSVAAYEQLAADGVKLAERVQERTEQLGTLRTMAERDLQQAAHLREALQGAHQAVIQARRNDERTTSFLQVARFQVLKLKKERDDLYKENAKLTRQMELLAYPDLLRDHEEVRWRLRTAQAELEQLRTAYANQERRIAMARELLLQRERNLRLGDRRAHSPAPSIFVMQHMDAKCGPSLVQVKRGS